VDAVFSIEIVLQKLDCYRS